MKMNILIAIILVAVSAAGHTESMSSMSASTVSVVGPFTDQQRQIFPVSNATEPYQLSAPMLVVFNGDGVRACPVQKDCIGAQCFESIYDDLTMYTTTGILAPVSYRPICDLSRAKRDGPTPVQIGIAENGVGISITNDPASTWGQHTNNPNKGISGVYAQWPLIHKPGTPMIPWGADCFTSNCDDEVSTRIEYVTTAKTVVASNKTQTQFNARIELLQRSCDRDKYKCGITINVKLLCAGGQCQEHTNAFADPGQGGLGVFLFHLPAAGESVKSFLPAIGDTKSQWAVPFATSIGMATQHGPYCKGMSGMTISWRQYKNILTRIAAVKRQSPLEAFGPGWDDRHNYRVISVGIGSETITIHKNSLDAGDISSFGGVLHSIKMTRTGRGW